MSEVRLGERPTSEVQDAIHAAVVAMEAACDLEPGQRVRRIPGTNKAAPAPDGGHGIVDPYLEHGPLRGQLFYLCLHPGSVTGMRHAWIHPDFAVGGVAEVVVPPTKEESVAWLKRFVAENDCPDYDTLILAATGRYVPDLEDYGDSYSIDGEYLHFNGTDAHGDIPWEFWDHVENATGLECDLRPAYFSCSC
jgi:hypothetical protein